MERTAISLTQSRPIVSPAGITTSDVFLYFAVEVEILEFSEKDVRKMGPPRESSLIGGV